VIVRPIHIAEAIIKSELGGFLSRCRLDIHPSVVNGWHSEMYRVSSPDRLLNEVVETVAVYFVVH